jgi:alanine racemase
MIPSHPPPESLNKVIIDTSALETNFRTVQQRVGQEVRVMAMVKADAYGHGMLQAARSFARAGCTSFAVAEIGEGVQLRQTGIEGRIFVLLGFQGAEVQLFFDYDLTPVIFEYRALENLSQAALRNGRKMAVHLKVDCGMGRLGFLPAELPALMARLDDFPGITLAGIMSHFPLADGPDFLPTLEMYQRFQAACAGSQSQGPVLCHIANSGAALSCPETRRDMVRPGISLYGCYPDGAKGKDRDTGEYLIPAMSFSTQVIQVKSLPPGTGISYGHSYITDKETRIAVLPVGYADGFLRALSNTAQVLIKGQRARIIGRVCMNLCMADVTDIPGVEPGEPVVILGSQGHETITADEIAHWMGTISYEVLCLFGNNNDRHYIT